MARPQTRRSFVTTLLTIVAGIAVLGLAACKRRKELKACTTSDDVLGPFYREAAPERTNLNVNSDPGTPLTISGTVFGVDCVTPLANATLEVWHADDSGAYDSSTSDFEFRGTVGTDSDGRYQFTTIVPGQYLNGSQYRPSHIHFKVNADGHKEVITQLYFAGDPFIGNDPWGSDSDAEERIIPLIDDGSGNMSGVFDIVLMSD